MARFFSQVASPLFLLLLVLGLVAGDALAGHGNLGPVATQFTWLRDGIDAVVLLLFLATGFVFSRRVGRIVTFVVGVGLSALGLLGIAVIFGHLKYSGDIRFPLGMDIFDLAVGILAVLAAAGTIEE